MPFLGPIIFFKYERRRVVLRLSERYAKLCWNGNLSLYAEKSPAVTSG
jgi:hypothetical protein